MKIRPVILCGGAGTRLWEDKKHHQPKQFIDFGGWNLMEKTLERIKNPIFDHPIISTNNKYLSQVRRSLKNSKIKKFKIVLEPAKKNTAPAILSSALIKDIPLKQSLMYFAADHLIEKTSIFNRSIKNNIKNLDDKNIFIFGIKPTNPSSEYGYFLTKKIKNINTPILIMHGKKDDVVPFKMGVELFDKANQPKFSYFSENDDHMMEFNDKLMNSLGKFLGLNT